jgi:hypothetical protein
VDALDVLKLCLRRWYVVVPVVLLSVAAGLGLAHQQKPTYTAYGSYALVYHSPQTTSQRRDPLAANPLAVNGAVLLGEALAADFMSSGSQATFGGVGHSGTAPREAVDGSSYSVSLPEGSQSYLVQTWGKDPDGLRTVVNSLLAAAPERAAAIQDRAGAPHESQFTTFVTGPTQLTKLPPTSRLKLLIAMLGVGILAGSALSLVVDRLVQRRKNQSAERVAQDPTSLEEPATAAEAEESQTLKVPVAGWAASSETEWADVVSTDVNAKSGEGAELAAATAPEDAMQEVYANEGDGLSPLEQLEVYQASMEQRGDVAAEQTEEGPLEHSEDVSIEQAEGVWGDEAEELPAEHAEELSGDQAGYLWGDQAEELPAEHAEELSGDQAGYPWGDQAEELPAEQAEELSIDQDAEGSGERPEELAAEQEPSARQTTDLQTEDAPIERAYDVAVEQVGRVPTEQGEHAAMEAEDADAEQAEDVPVEQPESVSAESAAEHDDYELPDDTNEKSQVNHADVEHQESETKPLTEYTTEPDVNARWDDSSSLDDGPWPVLEPERGFGAEDVSDNHARQHQPTH